MTKYLNLSRSIQTKEFPTNDSLQMQNEDNFTIINDDPYIIKLSNLLNNKILGQLAIPPIMYGEFNTYDIIDIFGNILTTQKNNSRPLLNLNIDPQCADYYLRILILFVWITCDDHIRRLIIKALETNSDASIIIKQKILNKYKNKQNIFQLFEIINSIIVYANSEIFYRQKHNLNKKIKQTPKKT